MEGGRWSTCHTNKCYSGCCHLGDSLNRCCFLDTAVITTPTSLCPLTHGVHPWCPPWMCTPVSPGRPVSRLTGCSQHPHSPPLALLFGTVLMMLLIMFDLLSTSNYLLVVTSHFLHGFSAKPVFNSQHDPVFFFSVLERNSALSSAYLMY